jgi:alpha-mannosidase
MNLVKNNDPLLLENYIRTRIDEINALSIIRKESLLPAQVYASDKRCGCHKLSSASDIAQYDLITDDFVLLEAPVVCPPIEDHMIPAISFRAGDYSESVLFVDGKEITGIAMARWDDGESVFLQLPEGKHTISIHVETDTSFGEVRSRERTTLEDFTFLIIDQRVRDICTHLEVLLDMYSVLSTREPEKHLLRENIIELYSLIEIGDYQQVVENYPQIKQLLDSKVLSADRKNSITVHMLGHAHIDIAWLWDIDKTKRKVVRTFLNQIDLIEKFPDMVFQQGQPWVYKYLKENHPQLYTEVKRCVASGNIEPAGGIWVECDMNVVGLESIIRQVLLGKSFIREEFGIDCKVLWMPDVFGFTGALPQILKRAGIDTMMTTKISWNQYTRFPHDTFSWSSPDGSEVLCHFIALPGEGKRFHTYNGKATVPEVYQSWDEYLDKDMSQDLLIPYGYGDGGGGPKERMLERIEIYRKNLPGFYRFRYSGIEGYRRILRDNVTQKELPTWHKDLYLQLHRGTYSTQSNVKKYNARLEHLLKSYEKLLVIFNQTDQQMQTMWEEYLVQQFHDILPGTSINKVYLDALEYHLSLEATLLGKIRSLLSVEESEETGNSLVFNPHARAYTGPVKHNGQYYGTENLAAVSLSRQSLRPLAFERTDDASLENDTLKIAINSKDGSISSVYDKEHGIEYCGDALNKLNTYEDRPIVPGKSAWLLEAYHRLKPLQQGLAVTEAVFSAAHGCSKCTLKGTVHSSDAVLDIVLFDGSPLIYFDLTIDWSEKNTVLKVENDLNLITDHVTYASHGCVIRKPNYADTLEEKAQFENPAQRWADMSEVSHGMTLMSDYKYSFSAENNRLSMILLRSPVSPDPSADQGTHSIRYALCPHLKTWTDADIPNIAKAFNEPPLVIAGATVAETDAFFQIRGTNPVADAVVVETIKGAEDGRGFILRCYESKGTRGSITIDFGALRLRTAFLCNLLEEDLSVVETEGNAVRIGYTPFEIITLRLVSEDAV